MPLQYTAIEKVDNDIRFASLADILISANCNPMPKILVSLTNEPMGSKAAASSARKIISASKANIQNLYLGIVGLTSRYFSANSRVSLLNYLTAHLLYKLIPYS